MYLVSKQGVITKFVVRHQYLFCVLHTSSFFRFFGSLYHFFPFFSYILFLVVLGIGSFSSICIRMLVLVFSSVLLFELRGCVMDRLDPWLVVDTVALEWVGFVACVWSLFVLVVVVTSLCDYHDPRMYVIHLSPRSQYTSTHHCHPSLSSLVRLS